MLGGQSCWKTDIDQSLKETFVGFQTAIEAFHGSKNYGNQFEPIKYKSQVVNGIVYTIQYLTADGTVQATVYVGAVKRTVQEGSSSSVKTVALEPQVTQFVDEEGLVTGAYRLGASIMMMASLVATVMLA